MSKKTVRNKFQSRRVRRYKKPPFLHVEKFADRDERDARFRELRAAEDSHDISKFSAVENNRSVWCVAKP